MLNFKKIRNLFESIWNSNEKVIKDNRKRKRIKKLEKGHGATIQPKNEIDPRPSSFSPEPVPFLPLPPR
jgi:hypothetical protein